MQLRIRFAMSKTIIDVVIMILVYLAVIIGFFYSPLATEVKKVNTSDIVVLSPEESEMLSMLDKKAYGEGLLPHEDKKYQQLLSKKSQKRSEVILKRMEEHGDDGFLDRIFTKLTQLLFLVWFFVGMYLLNTKTSKISWGVYSALFFTIFFV